MTVSEETDEDDPSVTYTVFTLDKTAREIIEAIDSGKLPIVISKTHVEGTQGNFPKGTSLTLINNYMVFRSLMRETMAYNFGTNDFDFSSLSLDDYPVARFAQGN